MVSAMKNKYRLTGNNLELARVREGTKAWVPHVMGP